MIVRGTGAEVEGQTRIGVAADTATGGVTREAVTAGMTIMAGRLPHAPPVLALIHLTTRAVLPRNDLHRMAHLALPLDFMNLDARIIQDHRLLPTGTPIHLGL